MIGLSFDLSDFADLAERIGGLRDQVPFALANALNDGVKAARDEIIQRTWPSHVTARDKNFIGRAMRRKFATKTDLTAELYDDLGRAHLAVHAKGGTKGARGRLAIPLPDSEPAQQRTARGIPRQLRPANLERRYGKNAVKVTPKGIFVAQHGRLKLVYSLKPSARIRKDVPFQEDFARVVAQEVVRNFPRRLQAAMRTARRK